MVESDFNQLLSKTGEVGYVDQVRQSLVFGSGLPGARTGELVLFETGDKGQVLILERDKVEILTFSANKLPVGTRIARTDSFLEVPLGSGLLGRVIDAFCQPLDEGSAISDLGPKRSLEVSPPGIIARRRVNRPLETGVSLVDMLIPLGKGQRELVIGDRKTGKTSFLLQTLVTQARQNTVCIYAAIGKRIVDVRAILEFLRDQQVMHNVILVASSSSDPAGLIFITPFSAMTIAEFFRDQGRDCLVILDDLTSHAKIYREISLIAGKFPGRESYPGDIFYVHSQLHERAGNFNQGSISLLPVAESLEGDISGYIQTNLMSMSDGHIYFDSDLFVKGRRPAINPFLSVSRVGHQTQPTTRRDIAREIRVVLSLYEKSSELAHFGSALLETIRLSLSIGEKVLFFFDQQAKELVPTAAQTIIFALLWGNFWTKQTREKIKQDISRFINIYQTRAEFRETVDSLVKETSSFNDLLGRVSQKQKFFQDCLS